MPNPTSPNRLRYGIGESKLPTYPKKEDIPSEGYFISPEESSADNNFCRRPNGDLYLGSCQVIDREIEQKARQTIIDDIFRKYKIKK
jgi:hypothetical protein